MLNFKNNNVISMKARLLIFFLMIGLVSMTSHNCVQAQNSSYDKQAVAMLKAFYTSYITVFSNWNSPIDDTKLNALQRKYCTTSLLNKIANQSKSGELESDPFLQAQDADISWLKTLSFKKDLKKPNSYDVSYIDKYRSEQVIIHITVIKQKESLKIASLQ